MCVHLAQTLHASVCAGLLLQPVSLLVQCQTLTASVSSPVVE